MAPEPRSVWRSMRGALTPAAETSESGWSTAARLQGTLLVRPGASRLAGRRALRRWACHRVAKELRRSCASSAKARCLQADSPDEVRDLLTALVLSECVYKVRRGG